MNAKHTPGPWNVREWAALGGGRKAYHGMIIYTGNKDHTSVPVAAALDVEKLVPAGEFYDQQRAILDANARLIAAAPEMLAALESICTEISGGLCMNYTGATGICPNAAKGQCAVWDAIQKAKGTIK